jgi:predicted ribosome quality control (RQC) complex YloA/Tae2 family protein
VISAIKVWEGQSCFLVWQAKTYNRVKFYLQANINGNDVSVEALEKKPDNLKPSGSLVSYLRKYAKSSVIKNIYKNTNNGDLWLPLAPAKSAAPIIYIQVRASRPGEIRFITTDKTIHMRRTNKGTFTKKATFDSILPTPDILEKENYWQDILPEMEALINSKSEADEIKDDGTEDISEEDDSGSLPEYQKNARSRLTRRLKTLRKSEKKLNGQIANPTEVLTLKSQAKTLQSHLYLAKPNSFELVIEPAVSGLAEETVIPLDPDLKPGANLDEYYRKIQKAESSITKGSKKLKILVGQIKSLETDLNLIKEEELFENIVVDILNRHGLKPATDQQQQNQKKHAAGELKIPYRIYTSSSLVPLMVGKSAADNDLMTKAAKANDTWIHVVGIPGSHVIIPAKSIKGSPDDVLIKEAAILAIHFSKLRGDLAGEVYVTTKQNVRKKKGLAPGMWLVEKAKSVFIRYEQSELEQLLGNAK